MNLKREIPADIYPIMLFAPGSYMCRCTYCKQEFIGDKRSFQCEPCALRAMKKSFEEAHTELERVIRALSAVVDLKLDEINIQSMRLNEDNYMSVAYEQTQHEARRKGAWEEAISIIREHQQKTAADLAAWNDHIKNTLNGKSTSKPGPDNLRASSDGVPPGQS